MSVKLIATKTTQHHKAGDRFTRPRALAKAMVKFRLAKYDESVQEELEQLSEDIQEQAPEVRTKRAYKRRDMADEEEPKTKKRAYKRRDMVAEGSKED